ncbi:MAG: hypothetical protein COB69_04505 [Phycisphaera sp.]|nr:MAG: hypothetical protein COB69_04505 [Phycisphaera sp.]
MSNDPYAAASDFQDYNEDGPPKTSVLAVLSLVCSLICFIPGLSAIGSLLGVFGLIRISSSNGRIKGTGLAIAGIAIGVIVSLLWIGGAVAIQQGAKQYLKLTEVMPDIDSGSYDSARGYLSSATRPYATDEAFESFKAAYEADAGSYVGRPEGLWNLLMVFGELGQAQDPNNISEKPYGTQQAPVPGVFTNGPKWILVGTNRSEINDAGTSKTLDNVGIWNADGSITWLVDPDVLGSGIQLPTNGSEVTPDAPEEAEPVVAPAGGG